MKHCEGSEEQPEQGVPQASYLHALEAGAGF